MRIRDLSALSPSTKLIDSKITDLPEPVSPDKTFKPFLKSNCAYSINAMFLITNLVIIKETSKFEK